MGGGGVWTYYAQRFLSDENRSIPIRNQCLRLPMACPLASASRREATRTSPHLPEAGARRHFLCSQEWLSLAHAAKRFSDLENRLPPLSMLVAFGVAGEYQCAPAPNAEAIGGQKQTTQRRDHRQPKRALQRTRRAGGLRCGQKDQGPQTLRLRRYTGLASGRGHYPGQHHRTLRSQGASSTCSPQLSAQKDLGRWGIQRIGILRLGRSPQRGYQGRNHQANLGRTRIPRPSQAMGCRADIRLTTALDGRMR